MKNEILLAFLKSLSNYNSICLKTGVFPHSRICGHLGFLQPATAVPPLKKSLGSPDPVNILMCVREIKHAFVLIK